MKYVFNRVRAYPSSGTALLVPPFPILRERCWSGIQIQEVASYRRRSSRTSWSDFLFYPALHICAFDRFPQIICFRGVGASFLSLYMLLCQVHKPCFRSSCVVRLHSMFVYVNFFHEIGCMFCM
jgi:hypothetical protein